MKISKLAESYLEKAAHKPRQFPEGEGIKVNAAISKASYIYEKIRAAIDYNEEHLVRKNAIFRILKRKMVLERMLLDNYLIELYDQDGIAVHLLQELIRGKFLDNNVSVKLAEETDKIIRKYSLLVKWIKENGGRVDNELFDFILQMEAVEIEQMLIPTDKERSLARVLFTVMKSMIVVENSNLNEKGLEIQLYVAAYRALYKWDDAMISHLLMNMFYPEWKDADNDLIKTIAKNIEHVKSEINAQINHPLRKAILKGVQKQSIVFWILHDVVEANKENASAILGNEEKLVHEVKKACEARYKAANVRLHRGVVRSIIYVFFTKMVLALAIEFPTDIYLTGFVNYVTAFTNILFPPLLMFLVASLIRLPGKDNTDAIVKAIKSLVFEGDIDKKIKVRGDRREHWLMNFIFNIIYAFTFIGSLVILCYFLHALGFNVFSTFIFVLFLTLVSFFSIRIRRPIKELLAIERRESVIGAIVDFFALPFVSMGQFLSGKFSKLNVFAYFMDFIIEAPFKLLIEIIEDLLSFLREKKEDVLVE